MFDAGQLYRLRLGAGNDPVLGSRILALRLAVVERAPVGGCPLSGCALSEPLDVPPAVRSASEAAA